MKKSIITSLVLIVLIAFVCIPGYVSAANNSTIPFTDVSISSWYYSAVKYAYENKLVSGINSKTFAPNQKLTRGMLVTILNRKEGSPRAKGKSTFTDVQDSSKYYYNSVVWATENKIVNGLSSKKFGPTANITREQLAVILYNYAKYKSTYIPTVANLRDFYDADDVAEWAYSGIRWTISVGIVNGSIKNNEKYLNPKGNATRAEATAMVVNYCKKVENNSNYKYIKMTEELYNKYNNDKYCFNIGKIKKNSNKTYTIQGRVYEKISLPKLTAQQYKDVINGKTIQVKVCGESFYIFSGGDDENLYFNYSSYHIKKNSDGTVQLESDYGETYFWHGIEKYMQVIVDEDIDVLTRDYYGHGDDDYVLILDSYYSNLSELYNSGLEGIEEEYYPFIDYRGETGVFFEDGNCVAVIH